MSEDIRELAFAFCMQEEGAEKYTNDPRDPGGPTKFGIALNYNRAHIPDKNGDGIVDARDVQLLTRADACKIYTDIYWTPNHCEALPGPLAFLYADMVFNPGPGIAPKLLQNSINSLGGQVVVDGKVGPATLAQIGQVWLKNPAALLVELSARRQQYYGTRNGFAAYGLGWSRRAARCLERALSLLWEAQAA